MKNTSRSPMPSCDSPWVGEEEDEFPAEIWGPTAEEIVSDQLEERVIDGLPSNRSV
jgi:hypothetical protein